MYWYIIYFIFDLYIYKIFSIFVKNIIIAETKLNKPTGQYWENLDKAGVPYYLYLDNELVIIKYEERKKRKKGGKINQVYYHLEDGRVKHASFFKKVADLKIFIRDFKISQILNE